MSIEALRFRHAIVLLLTLGCAQSRPPDVIAANDHSYVALVAPRANVSFRIPPSFSDGGVALNFDREIETQFFFASGGGDLRLAYADRMTNWPRDMGNPPVHLPLKTDWSKWDATVGEIEASFQTFRMSRRYFGIANWRDSTGDHSIYMSGRNRDSTYSIFMAVAHTVSKGSPCSPEYLVETQRHATIKPRGGTMLFRCEPDSIPL